MWGTKFSNMESKLLKMEKKSSTNKTWLSLCRMEELPPPDSSWRSTSNPGWGDKKTVLQKRDTQRRNFWPGGLGWGMGDGIVRKFGMDAYTLLCLKWITNKDLLCSAGNSAQCYVAAWMGGEFGGKWIHVYVWLSAFALHLKLSQHVNWLYTSIQNKK